LDIRVTKLQEVIDLLKPAIAKKATLKTITYMYLGEGKAVATDLETMVIANLPEAKEPMLLPYSAVSAMLRFVPGTKMLKIELKGKAVSFSWDGGSASYPTEDAAGFPIMPALETKAEAMIDGDTLIAALQVALPYVATDEKRPVLSGITLVLGAPIEVAAGDGFRASLQALGLTFPMETKVIVPSHNVAILEHVFKKTPRTPPASSTAMSLVQVVTAKRNLRMSLIGENKLRLDFGTNASVVMNLIVGDPPQWLSLVPQGEPIMQSHLFAPQLEVVAKRVQGIAKDGSGAVRLEFAEGKLTVSAHADDQDISSVIDTINTQGEPSRLGVNVKYLLEFVSGKQGIISLTRYTETGPVVLEYQKMPKVLIMPMQIQWPGDTPPAAEPEPVAETTEETSDSEEGNADEGETETSDEEVTTEDTVEEPAAEVTE
jgi:DNA polymerase III sliding clamp (beta) subunit (PCNA family)